MKTHYQRGTIYEASGSFFVGYAANIDGVKQRVSHKLCDRDEEHYSTDCDKVLELRDAHMVDSRKPKPRPTTETLVTEFWADVHLPFINDNLKASTMSGYEQIWEQRLKEHFTGRTLQAYENG
jgi:hypothetical protein